LPRDLGIGLVALGACGLAIPGPAPPRVPLFVAGLFLLFPNIAKRLGAWLKKRFPVWYGRLHALIDRFRPDLQRRYPGSVG
jgi:hypothetical protein